METGGPIKEIIFIRRAIHTGFVFVVKEFVFPLKNHYITNMIRFKDNYPVRIGVGTIVMFLVMGLAFFAAAGTAELAAGGTEEEQTGDDTVSGEKTPPASEAPAETGGTEEGIDEGLEKATFGAGCFWGVEKAFQETDGVVEAISGYAGGDRANPSYREVCSGETGHAEVVQVLYDPKRISYDELLRKYWSLGFPSWGPSEKDRRSQYRHIILYHSEGQRKAAEASLKGIEKQEGQRIAVYLEPLEKFYPAEGYHQNYFMR